MKTAGVGALCVGSAWGSLILYNIFSAREPVLEMLSVMGAIMGNLHGSLIVLLTLIIGSVIGLLGALIGTQLKGLYKERFGTDTKYMSI